MDSIKSSLDTYELQLEQVQQALSADPENADLAQLNEDLQQLISLTTQSFIEAKKEEILNAENEAKKNEKEATLAKDLDQLVGMKCKAPYKGRSSHQLSKCNGIIFHLEEGAHHQCCSFDDIMVRVVFSHPTSLDMVPCQYYLDGKCRFSDERCKFSHGEIVRLSSLTEFEDPDFALVKEGAKVLAKSNEDSIWYHATVETAEGNDVFVRFEQDHRHIKKVNMEDVFPLKKEDDRTPEGTSDRVNFSSEDSNSCFAPVTLLDGKSSFGAWEGHTKQIGSRLMEKMGYIRGKGLGKSSEGIVEPVTAMIYPSGKSLDWCMAMREKAGGSGDALSVEKTLMRRKAREEKKIEKLESQIQSGESVFNFINSALRSKRGNVSQLKEVHLIKTKSVSQKGQSNKNQEQSSNVQAFKLGEEIRRTEKEINRIKESLSRNEGKDKLMAQEIKRKLSDKVKVLESLKSREKSFKHKSDMASNNKKLQIF